MVYVVNNRLTVQLSAAGKARGSTRTSPSHSGLPGRRRQGLARGASARRPLGPLRQACTLPPTQQAPRQDLEQSCRLQTHTALSLRRRNSMHPFAPEGPNGHLLALCVTL